MNKKDYVLAVANLAYFLLIGPWLISAESWIAVGLGIVLGGVLIERTFTRILRIMKEKTQ